MSKAIEIKNLHYSYRSDWLYKSINSLFDLTLDIESGEAFGFLGPNGAGKTTTIKLLLNLIKPKQGSINIFGIDSRLELARKSVGYLPEQPYFYDHLSVIETLEMYGTLAGIEERQLKDACETALKTVGLLDRRSSRMRSLSKGLTQRVGLAQAIIANPKLLILDEPFSGLDPIGRKEFFDIFLKLKNSGVTIFMSSHVLSDVEALCDRVSILVKGKLQGVFKVSEIAEKLNQSYELVLVASSNLLEQFPKANEHSWNGHLLRLSYASEEQAMNALNQALRLNIAVQHYGFVHGGLEEFFVNLVKSTNNNL